MSRTPRPSGGNPRLVCPSLVGPRFVGIVGPTAVGKTRLAVSLAQRFTGEIINADSRQVYRGMDIGTAKPTLSERASAPHHLVDFIDPSESFGLAVFLDLAKRAADEIGDRGHLPIVAGGTGQYVWGLLEGKGVPRVPPDPAFRRALEQEAEADGGQALYRRLQEVDPARAATLDPRNVRRVIRALEIHQATGNKPSGLSTDKDFSFNSLVVGLTMDRKALYRRIDERVDRMMDDGLLAEVETLAATGYPPGQGPLGSPGYREMGLYLSGQLSLDEAVQRTKTQTHRLARRQYNWFKLNDPRIHWLDASGSGVDQEAAELVAAFMDADSPVIQ